MLKNKKHLKLIIWGVLLISLASCGKKEEKGERISPVKLLEIKENSQGEERVFNGSIIPEKESVLAFKVPGKIEKILVKEGTPVKKGDVLAQLEKEDYKIGLRVYQKKYEGALENYRAHEAIAENAELQFERIEKLYGEKATTKKIYDEVQGKYRSAVAAKKGSLALLEEAGAGVENSRNRLEDTVLRAPYDAYVGNVLGEEGSVVNGGTPVLALFSEKSYRVSMGVSEKELPFLLDSKEIFFLQGEKKYPLTIKETGKKPNLSNLSYPVILEFSQAGDFLNGSQGKVVVRGRDNSSGGIKIPLEAIFENNGKKVWIYKDGIALSREIEIEKTGENGEVIVKSGLVSGEKIVVAGTAFLYEGEKIKPIPQFSESNPGKIL